jgi:cyclomaltodextrinase
MICGLHSLRLAAALLAVLIALPATTGALADGGAITLAGDGGDAWTFEKSVEGVLPDGGCDQVLLSSPRATVRAWSVEDRFGGIVPLQEGENEVRAVCHTDGHDRSVSEPQPWHVYLEDMPKAWIRVVPAKGSIILNAGASEPAPVQAVPITGHAWQDNPQNPEPLRTMDGTLLDRIHGEGRQLTLRIPRIDGDYRITLRVTDALGRTDDSTALIQVENGRGHPAEPGHEQPAWIEDAIIYGVVPFFFGDDGFDDVTRRLPEIEAAGATVLWLSPITDTAEDDFGYGVTDHFALRDTFGSEEDLRELIAAAHARGLRVILDFVPNHTSDRHPYYLSASQRGPGSPYYRFYDRDAAGEATTYFDWANLKNLNYDNPEVQRYMTEAFVHWVRTFGIDGFRMDVGWGVRERAPEFWPKLLAELKRIRPDLLLLAEASARDPYYDSVGFDAAYDWTEEPGEWAWHDAFADDVPTAARLRAALRASETDGTDGPMLDPDVLVFRFLNNNDTGARFITRYGVGRARLAATMLLTLPGLPLIYTGDEVGAEFEPYDEGPPLAWTDPHKLRSHYARLASLRRQYPALRSPRLELLEASHPDTVLAYRRPGETPASGIIVLLNYGQESVRATLRPEETWHAASFVDLLSGKDIPVTGNTLAVDLPALAAAMLLPKAEDASP